MIGIGLLTKWTFALAIAAPLAWLAWSALARRESRRAEVARLGLGLGLAAVLAGPWYAWNLSALLAEARRAAITTAVVENEPAFGSARYFLYDADSLLRDGFYLPLFLALAAGGALAARRNRRLLGLLNLTVWPFYLGITLVPNKDPRYAFPLLPVLGVALAAGVLAVGPFTRKIRPAS